jgi:phage terminase large subunit
MAHTHIPNVGDKDFDSEKATAHLTADLRTDPRYDTSREHDTATCCWCKERGETVSLYSFANGRYWRCPKEQCFQRQRLYEVSVGTEGQADFNVLFLPLPVQVKLIEAVLQQKWTRLLFSGSVGSSKSYGLRWLAYFLCLRKPGFKILLLRRTFKQLEDSHTNPAQEEEKSFGGAMHYRSTEKVVVFHNGSRLRFGHCENAGDEYNFQGDAYDLILFDEQTLFLEQMITYIGSRARTDRKAKFGDDWTPVVLGATNPEGPSKDFCLAHYIDKSPDPEKYPKYNPDRYHCIYSLLWDNPYLNENYIESLWELPKHRQDALINGDWHAASEGTFFDEFQKTDQMLANGHILKAHTKFVVYGPELDRFRTIDWGYVDHGCVLWWVCLSDSKYHVEDEYTFQRTEIPDVCDEIKRRDKERGIKVRYTVASPDLFPVSGQPGETRAETFRKCGVPLRKANNQRVQGWQRLRELFRHDPAGDPTLTIDSERCPNLVKTIPQLVSDEKRPEDVAGSKKDHWAEALRYGAMSRPAPTRFPRTQKVQPNSGQELIEQIMAKLREERAS